MRPKVKYQDEWHEAKDIFIKRNNMWESLSLTPQWDLDLWDSGESLAAKAEVNYNSNIQSSLSFIDLPSDITGTNNYKWSVLSASGDIVFCNERADIPPLKFNPSTNAFTRIILPHAVSTHGVLGYDGNVYLFATSTTAELKNWYPVYQFNPYNDRVVIHYYLPGKAEYIWIDRNKRFRILLNEGHGTGFIATFDPKTKLLKTTNSMNIDTEKYSNGNMKTYSYLSAGKTLKLVTGQVGYTYNFNTTKSIGKIIIPEPINLPASDYYIPYPNPGSDKNAYAISSVYNHAVSYLDSNVLYSIFNQYSNNGIYQYLWSDNGIDIQLLGIYETGDTWDFGIAGPDSFIYWAPSNASKVVRIRPRGLSSVAQKMYEDLPTDEKWGQGVMDFDNNIYFAPLNSTRIMKITFEDLQQKFSNHSCMSCYIQGQQ